MPRLMVPVQTLIGDTARCESTIRLDHRGDAMHRPVLAARAHAMRPYLAASGIDEIANSIHGRSSI